MQMAKEEIKHIKSKDGYNISIHSLFYSAGLLNTYRFEKPESNIDCLKLVFDKNKLIHYALYDVVDKPIKSLLDLITCSRYFVNLKMISDKWITFFFIFFQNFIGNIFSDLFIGDKFLQACIYVIVIKDIHSIS